MIYISRHLARYKYSTLESVLHEKYQSQNWLFPDIINLFIGKNFAVENMFQSFYTLFLKIHDYENRACHSSDIAQTLSLDLHFTNPKKLW